MKTKGRSRRQSGATSFKMAAKLCVHFTLRMLRLQNVSKFRIKSVDVHTPFSHGRQLHTTQPQNDLMEFFDNSKNWGAQTIKVGRSWRKEELRIKSNSDLHKLWYVLLKERNMLLTMEYACKMECELFPNPERIDKIEESMENLEDVVRERNKAYYELETTETGEAPSVDLKTPFGKLLNREIKEYPIPKHMNRKWQQSQIVIPPEEIAWFNAQYRELQNKNKRKEMNRRRSSVQRILRDFPNADEEAIKEQYPDVDLEVVKGRLKKYF